AGLPGIFNTVHHFPERLVVEIVTDYTMYTRSCSCIYGSMTRPGICRCVIVMRIFEHVAFAHQTSETVLTVFVIIAVKVLLANLVNDNSNYKSRPLNGRAGLRIPDT